MHFDGIALVPRVCTCCVHVPAYASRSDGIFCSVRIEQVMQSKHNEMRAHTHTHRAVSHSCWMCSPTSFRQPERNCVYTFADLPRIYRITMQSVTSDIRLFLMALHTVTYMASAQFRPQQKIPKSRAEHNGRSNGVNGTHELLPLILLWHALFGCCSAAGLA